MPFAVRTGADFVDRISAKQTVRPDPYADRCCITVRVFHCANRPSAKNFVRDPM
jgi:hypothetical protein